MKDLKTICRYAEQHGYKAMICKDHVIATNKNGSIRSANMRTFKKLMGK